MKNRSLAQINKNKLISRIEANKVSRSRIYLTVNSEVELEFLYLNRMFGKEEINSQKLENETLLNEINKFDVVLGICFIVFGFILLFVGGVDNGGTLITSLLCVFIGVFNLVFLLIFKPYIKINNKAITYVSRDRIRKKVLWKDCNFAYFHLLGQHKSLRILKINGEEVVFPLINKYKMRDLGLLVYIQLKGNPPSK